MAKSVLSAVRPEYVPLDAYVSEPLAWCPAPATEEGSTVYVIVRSGDAAPKILKLANGRVSPVAAKKLPFKSAIVEKPKTLVDYLKAKSVFTGLAYLTASILLAFVLAVSTNVMSARVVLTNSMSGTIEPGDVVIAANWMMPKTNDIAIYQARDFDGKVRAEFVHRVIGGSAETVYEFKGDNNPVKDALSVAKKDIVGVVLFWIPNLGSLLNPKNLLAIFSIGVFIYFAFGYVRDELIERKYFKRKGSK
jgi:signal peptidase